MHIKLSFIKAYMKMSVSNHKSITLSTMALRWKCDSLSGTSVSCGHILRRVALGKKGLFLFSFDLRSKEAEADYTCRDLDYSRYHKSRRQLLFYYTLFYGKYVWNASRFYCASKNTRTNAPSGRIFRNHSSARALKPKVYYACAMREV